MAKSKKVEMEPDEMRIMNVKFRVQKDRKRAVCTFHYKRTESSTGNLYEADVMLYAISIWQHPNTGRAIAATLPVQGNSPRQLMLLHRMRQCGLIRDAEDKDIFATPHADCIRLGPRPGSDYEFYVQSLDEHAHILPSKEAAIACVLEKIGRIRQLGNIGGRQFSKVPQDMLVSAGCLEIPDIMGIGKSMWAVPTRWMGAYWRTSEEEINELVREIETYI